MQTLARPSQLEVVPSHTLLGSALQGHVGHHDDHLDAELGLVAGKGDGCACGDGSQRLLVDEARAATVVEPATRVVNHEAAHAIGQGYLATSLSIRVGHPRALRAGTADRLGVLQASRSPNGHLWICPWIGPGGVVTTFLQDRMVSLRGSVLNKLLNKASFSHPQ